MKVKAIVIGYGSRGAAYSAYAAEHPEELQIAAVAEPIPNRREYAAKLHNLVPENVFEDWRSLEQQPKMADFALLPPRIRIM